MNTPPELELVSFVQNDDLVGLKAVIDERIDLYSKGDFSADDITLDTCKLVTAMKVIEDRIKLIEGRYVLWNKERKNRKEEDLRNAKMLFATLHGFYKVMLYSRELAWAKAKGVEFTDGQHTAILIFNLYNDEALGIHQN